VTRGDHVAVILVWLRVLWNFNKNKQGIYTLFYIDCMNCIHALESSGEWLY
jgi:hypothetical protein